MILMKEESGASYQYRCFEDLPAVAKFFHNESGRVFPRTRHGRNMEIIPQPEISEDNLTRWTPINTSGCIGYFQLILADEADIEIPNDLKWHDGRSNAFGRGQSFIPDMASFLNP